MSKRLNFEDIKEYINNSNTGNGCLLLTDNEMFENEKSILYKPNTRVKLLIKCKCGCKFITTYDTFKNENKKQCSICGKNKGVDSRKNKIEDIKSFIELNSNCKLISKDYINIHSKLKLQCECGNIFTTTYSDFKYHNQRQCLNCGNINRSESQSFNLSYIKDIINKLGYELISNVYKNCNTKLILKDNSGYYYLTTLNRIEKGVPNKFHKCNPYTIQNIKLWCKINNKPFELVSNKYNGSDKKLEWKCENSEHDNWFACWNNIIAGETGCPSCVQSKGENIINKYLSKKNYIYKHQYRIYDCRDKNPLPFDFAIFKNDKCKRIKCLIEYDGEQHYRPIDFAGDGKEIATEKFINTKFRDKIKSEYCKVNHITLIRIPYYNLDNIEEILQKQIK